MEKDDQEIRNAISFAQWLTDQLRDKNLSMTRLAKLADMSPQSISAYAGAKPDAKTQKPNSPRLETIRKIAKGLGVPIAEARAAAGYASELLPPLDTADRFALVFRELSTARQNDLLKIAEALQALDNTPHSEDAIDDVSKEVAPKG